MTYQFSPARAAFHRLMILAGLPETYDREMDEILENSPELDPLVVELALCLSDRARTAQILGEYLMDHPPEPQEVFDLVIGELRCRYDRGELDCKQTVDALWNISNCRPELFTEDQDLTLRIPSYAYEYVEMTFYKEEDFRRDFDFWLHNGTPIPFPKLTPEKKHPIRDFISNLFRK